jgi:hypothetical protein
VRSAEFLAKVRFMMATLSAGESQRWFNQRQGPTLDYKVVLLVPRPPALEGECTAINRCARMPSHDGRILVTRGEPS